MISNTNPSDNPNLMLTDAEGAVFKAFMKFQLGVLLPHLMAAWDESDVAALTAYGCTIIHVAALTPEMRPILARLMAQPALPNVAKAKG